MKRVITIVLAAVVLTATAVWAQNRFSDVSVRHSRAADIAAVSSSGWFGGYPDGSFKPERRITVQQMARVLGRAFPDGMTRSEFASFMVGGNRRVEHNPNGGMIASNEDAVVTVNIPAGTYRFVSSTTDWGDVTIATVDGSGLAEDGILSSQRLADSWGNPTGMNKASASAAGGI